MSDGYRNGAFALGLVVGGGLAVNLFVWSAYFADSPSQQNTANQIKGKGSEPVPFWDWLFGTFIDTIAQWVMAILSLAAVVLLWMTMKSTRQTLAATRRMASDTAKNGVAQVESSDKQLAQVIVANNIARKAVAAQSRPFLIIETLESTMHVWANCADSFRWNAQITNLGSTPAFIEHVLATLRYGSRIDCHPQFTHVPVMTKLKGMTPGLSSDLILQPGDSRPLSDSQVGLVQLAKIDPSRDVYEPYFSQLLITGQRAVWMDVASL